MAVGCSNETLSRTRLGRVAGGKVREFRRERGRRRRRDGVETTEEKGKRSEGAHDGRGGREGEVAI